MMDTMTVRVEAVRDEATDIKSYRLVSIDGSALPAWTAGAHIDVQLGSALRRQYSLCGNPDDCASYLIAVKREPASRGGSATMHDKVRAGSRLQISSPRNAFALCKDAAQYLLLAGGIGITPLFAMARTLSRHGRPFHLHYFTRSPEHAAFDGALRAELAAEAYRFHAGVPADQMPSMLPDILGNRSAQAHLYLCGPRPFMDAIRKAAAPAWPQHAIHLEHFDGSETPAAGDEEFVLRLARAGIDISVPANKSIIAALAEYDIHVDTSCEQGICGTCIVDVCEGIPDHRDEVLSETERQSCSKIATCVSRSRTRVLVLDL